MKAGIVLDDWKLPVFRKRLAEAGYAFKEVGHFTANTSVLTIETEFPANLKIVVEGCQAECARQKAN